MRAELKWLHSPDALDLENWQPEEADHFGILVQAMIGPVGEIGADSFDFRVCTPSWFGECLLPDRPMSGERTLFVARWDYRALVGYIERYVRRSESSDWQELARKLSHLGGWEFEDYRPFDP